MWNASETSGLSFGGGFDLTGTVSARKITEDTNQGNALMSRETKRASEIFKNSLFYVHLILYSLSLIEFIDRPLYRSI